MKQNFFSRIKSKRKSVFLFASGISIAAISTFTLAACSRVDNTLLEATVNKGDGNFFVSNQNINSVTARGLQNSSAQNEYFNNATNQLMLSFIENLANSGNNISIANALTAQRRTIDENFDAARNSSRNNNGVNFPLVFQQQELDPNGGTEESWKRSRLLDWARTQFSSMVFQKNFLTVLDNNGNPVFQPSVDQITRAVSNDGFDFGFSPRAANANIPINNDIDPIFSRFQQFIFDKWVQIDNPFIINMSLWRYGNPRAGINSVYDSEAANSLTAPNYSFPFFTNNASQNNENGGTLTKFTNFLSAASTTNGFIENNTLGLREIPQRFTDDNSTFILAKNSTISSDLFIEFASGATYLLYRGKTFADAPEVNVPDINAQLNTTINANSTLRAIDPITATFVRNASINNRDIRLSNTLARSIINPTGEFRALANGTNEIFITDTVTSTETGLSNFLFLRNEAGVHAIGIDGKTYIDTATTLANSKINAADIVLYRHFLNRQGFSNFAVDIQTELSNFLTTNLSYLVWEYLNDSTIDNSLKFATPIAQFGTTTTNFINLLSNFLFNVSQFNRSNQYQDRMFSAKQTFSTNVGQLAENNGLAAPWVYDYVRNTNNFNITRTLDAVSNVDDLRLSRTNYISAINQFVSQLNLLPLTSGFEGFQFSQYILTNDFFINEMLNSYGTDGNSLGNGVRIEILQDFVRPNVNLNNLTFNSSIWTNSFFNSRPNQQLDDAMSNFFFNSVFNSATDRWSEFNLDANINVSLQNLNTYRRSLWNDSNLVLTSTATDSFLQLFTVMSTVNFLLANDGEQFLNYLSTRVLNSEDVYVAWSQQNNTLLERPNPNVGQVLNVNANNLTKNIGNTYRSSYFGATPSDTLAITNNIIPNSNANFANESNYYNYVGNTVGYLGLQSQNSNSLPATTSNLLFTNPTQVAANPTGLLYAYTSRTALVEQINGLRLISQVENLARDLFNKTKTISIDSVIRAEGLENKRQALIAIVNNTTSIPNSMFMPRTGYLSRSSNLLDTNGLLIPSTTASNVLLATKLLQLNSNDVRSLSNLNSAFNALTTNTAEKTSIFFNLVIQAAIDSSQQDIALRSILATRQVTAFDVRMNNQLGPRWVRNFV